MVVLLITLMVLAVLVAVGVGLVALHKAGKLAEPESDPDELDENIPAEKLHSIVKHEYVLEDEKSKTRVLAQVVCVCGWTTATTIEDTAKSRGEQHVNNERERVRRVREVAAKLAKNEKGDFAW